MSTRRMAREGLHPFPPECIDAGVGPHVRTVPTKSAEFNVVEVRLHPRPGRPQSVRAETDRTTPSWVRLVPDDQVQHAAEQLTADVDEEVDVAPIHAHVVNRAGRRCSSPVAKGLQEKSSKLSRVHFAGCKGEFAVANAATAADRSDADVVGRIAKHRGRRRAVHEQPASPSQFWVGTVPRSGPKFVEAPTAVASGRKFCGVD